MTQDATQNAPVEAPPEETGPAQTDNRPRYEDGPQDDVSQDPNTPYLGAEASQ